MAIPFASGYAPINLLNNAIQAQDARRDQGYLDSQRINEASISDALNRVVQQKALQQQAAAQQQHYGLQQQQLANDLAYRNQALGLTAQQQNEAKRQFDAKLELDRAIANANIKQMERPGYGLGKDVIPFALQANQDASKANAEAGSIANNANIAVKALKADRDAKLGEIAITRGRPWYDIRHPIDLLKDAYTTDDDWAKQVRQIDSKYRADVLALSQAPGIQGKLTIRNKVAVNPQTGQQIEIPDEFEVVPVTLPGVTIPGMQPAPQPLPPLLTQPPAATPVNPIASPFSGLVPPSTGSNQNAAPKIVVPPVTPSATNRVLRWVPGQGLVPVQ